MAVETRGQVTAVEPRSIANGAMVDAVERQRAHYDRIADSFEIHYSDRWSLEYRRRFINEPLTRGLDLKGCNVLDAMCGSGQMASYLVEVGARVTGLDISRNVLAQFRAKLPDAVAVQGSIYDTAFADACFDHVFVVGGLHHAHPRVDRALDEIHRILKPGGYLCFAEPHAGSLPDIGRRVWYRFDHLFESNEAGIDLRQLKSQNGHRFEFEMTRYTGALGYLLVHNSYIFRVPLTLKQLYTLPVLRLEAMVERVQGRLTSCAVLGRWRKKQG